MTDNTIYLSNGHIAKQVYLNKAQRKALFAVWSRGAEFISYREFRARVVAGYDCVMVPWCNMWLGIEKDGYTHS